MQEWYYLGWIQFTVEILSDNYVFWRDSLEIITGIKKSDNNIPKVFSLKQNFPNPFNPSTTIVFTLPKTEVVSLKIYNLLGQEVFTLVSEKLTPGEYKYTWNASQLASGVYFYKLVSGNYSSTKKLILLR